MRQGQIHHVVEVIGYASQYMLWLRANGHNQKHSREVDHGK